MAGKSRTIAIVTAIGAAVAGLAAFLGNIETIITKPGDIARSAGLVETPAAPVAVRLAEISAEEQARLVYGADVEAIAVSFQPYTQRGSEFCLAGRPMDGCTAAPVQVQPPFAMIGYIPADDAVTGPWAPGIPVFDVISVRWDAAETLLTRMRVEWRKVVLDRRPMVAVAGDHDAEGMLSLVAQSATPIRRVTLALGFREVISAARLKAWLAQRGASEAFTDLPERISLSAAELPPLRSGYDGRAAAPGRAFAIDLHDAILRAFPGSAFVPYPEGEASGQTMLEGVAPVRGFASRKGDADFDEGRNLLVMVAGTITVTPEQGAAWTGKFLAPVIVKTERGFGAVGVGVDNRAVITLDPSKPIGAVERPVSLLLNDASPTVRSRVALVSRASATFELRFVYGTIEDADHMASPWLRVQTFTSPEFAGVYFR